MAKIIIIITIILIDSVITIIKDYPQIFRCLKQAYSGTTLCKTHPERGGLCRKTHQHILWWGRIDPCVGLFLLDSELPDSGRCRFMCFMRRFEFLLCLSVCPVETSVVCFIDQHFTFPTSLPHILY